MATCRREVAPGGVRRECPRGLGGTDLGECEGEKDLPIRNMQQLLTDGPKKRGGEVRHRCAPHLKIPTHNKKASRQSRRHELGSSSYKHKQMKCKCWKIDYTVKKANVQKQCVKEISR